MHAVLGHFVCSTGEGLDFLTIKMIEGHTAFADGVTFLDGFGDVSLRESSGVEEGAASGKLCGDGRGKSASGTVSVLGLYTITAKLNHFVAIEKHVNRALHVAALDDHRVSAHLDELARGRFHVRDVFYCQPG